MKDDLKEYLLASYRKDVMHQSAKVETLMATPEQIAEAKAELAKINALGLGSSLAQRDFVSYQNKRALEKFLKDAEPGG